MARPTPAHSLAGRTRKPAEIAGTALAADRDMLRRVRLPVAAAIPLLLVACSHDGPSDGPPPAPSDPGTTVGVGLPPDRASELASLRQALDATRSLTADSLEAQRELPFAASLSYDPLASARLDTIQASSLALAPDEKASLAERGFVISDRHRFPSFAYGLAAVYAEDLPLYVTADAILDAVHRSYDDALRWIEMDALLGDLGALLGATRARLAAGGASGFDASVRADADLYLAVAAALLSGSAAPPVAGADPAAIASLVSAAQAHAGTATVSLFGLPRDVDFSQFTPRGHYTDTPELGRYFQAMMWLGRTELRILETKPDGTQAFRRRQLEGAFALRDLFEPASRAAYQRIDDTVSAFVGEHDSMTLPELDALLSDLGIADASGLSAIDDATLAKTVIDHGYGQQRIASQLIVNGIGGTTFPLNASFLLFGQRFVVDSYVFSNLVYDRVGGGDVLRMMPNPLDVAYAALANDQAVQLLDGDLRAHPYAPDLEAMRLLVDAHGEDYWSENLYDLWLASLRALSPVAADLAKPQTSGLPTVATTEAWGRRLVSTQLGSWAELRHDTILYAKQSYTSGASCSFPDAFVDPYPAFWARLVAFADRGRTLVAGLDVSNATSSLKSSLDGWFASLHDTAAMLQSMAQAERDGADLTPAQLAFINQAVHVQPMCDGAEADGWYAKLLLDRFGMTKFDPTIADVHTQPTDENGTPVGKVLHVGTGSPRLLVATIDRCGTPSAYVGMVLPYFERVTENFDRLDDVRWKQELDQKTPDEVPWMKDLVAR